MLKDKLQSIFSDDYPGYSKFADEVVCSIFGTDFERYPMPVPMEIGQSAINANIKSINRIGTINDNDNRGRNPIEVFDVTINDNAEITRSRVNIQTWIRSELGFYTHAFIIFHYANPDDRSWRLSYLYKPDTISGATKAKRYTYLLGKSFSARTITENFVKLASSPLDDKALGEAFSVQALSDDFFKEYRELYADFCQYITGKRFVKEGGKWVERELSKPNYQYATTFSCDDKLVRDYIKKMFGRIVFLYFLQRKGWLDNNRKYMHDLFANSSQKDNFLDGVLEPLFFDVLNTDKQYRTEAARALPGSDNIPYLNGGLFAQDDIDILDCAFPENYFKRLFDFLDSYNFTIDENDSDDAEVGIDPEMLGRIFENLLEDNKDKGAFYTPKEIVDYMCRESIIAYLQDDRFSVEGNASIRQFVETLNAEPLNAEQKTYLRRKLQAVKICDPAIGSGAFPMGLVNLLSKLYVAMKADTDTAKMKRHIMEQNIYGVDIEKGAVDIARLRFWLAMIVEEKKPMPLPNLHFKIMQGNSLLESYNGIDLSDLTKVSSQKSLFDSDDIERESLFNALKKYYQTSDHSTRDSIFNDIINNVRRQLFSKGVTLPQGMDPSANDCFFLWHTWFADIFSYGGFDIVIGNPPYGANIDALTSTYEKLYPNTSKGYKDIYKYFFDQGLRLTKENGVLCYITPNTYLRQPRYGDVRRHLLNYNIIQVLDLGEDIFEDAVVPVAITLVKNNEYGNIVNFVDLVSSITNENAQEILSHFTFNQIQQSYWSATINNIFTPPDNTHASNAVILDDILSFKDAGINYQRVKVGLAQKGKSDLSARLLYDGTQESESDVEYWKGSDISSYFISEHTSRFCRTNISLRENERVILNSEYFSISPKLIWRQTAPYPICAVDYKGIWFGRSIQAGLIKPKYSSQISYEYLCGLLNSSLLRHYYELNVKEGGRVFPQVKLEKLKPLPIVIPNNTQRLTIEVLVKSITSDEENFTKVTQKIDALVYKLYGLKYDEIIEIDTNFTLSADEYQSFLI